MKYKDFIKTIEDVAYDYVTENGIPKMSKTFKDVALETYIMRDRLISEKIDDRDLKKLRDIIRIELADLFFDLYKRRNVWI